MAKAQKQTPEFPPYKPKCENCPYWKHQGPHKETQQLGLCLRNPPTHTAELTAFGPLTKFTVTSSETVCGEHPQFTLPTFPLPAVSGHSPRK